MKTVLYIIKTKNHPIYKIGITDSIVGRLRLLNSNSPFPLIIYDLYRDLNDPIKIEKMLHKHFKKENSHNEWFKLTDKQAKGLKDIIYEFNEGMEKVDRGTKNTNRKTYELSYGEMIKRYFKRCDELKDVGNRGRTRGKICKELGITDGNLARLIAIHKYNPELINEMDEENISINHVYSSIP